ncbi:MAG: dTMP kinase [Lachnospiraceae bacterium]
MRGIFITLEGADGSGKSTQITLLQEYLKQQGFEVVLSREPGATAIGEKIRQVILDKENREMGHMTELMLYASARAQLVEEVIQPALECGKAVICDRFVDSSAVYQGMGRGLGVELVYEVNKHAIRNIMPDVTFFIDISAQEGIRRKKNQAELDRMELETISFHEKVVEGYRSLARQYPERIKSIDGMLPVEEIQDYIRQEVAQVCKSKNICPVRYN